jgi:GDPmannose 4,6-dehydratase
MRVIVTGYRGQDGTLLCRLLRGQGHEVLGIGRGGTEDGSSVVLTNDESVRSLIRRFEPDQIYHLAASHHSSEQSPDIAFERDMIDVNFRAAEVLLAAVAQSRPSCRILLAATSKMYRPVPNEVRVIDEESPMDPASFYGQTKAWSRDLLSHFRDRWSLFGSTAILFNHESVLRPPQFVTRKITMAAARAKRGARSPLNLLDIHSQTDWCGAEDVVEGMRLSLSADHPADYVFASGKARSVSDVLDVAYGEHGMDWRDYVTSSAPKGGQKGALIGNINKARDVLGWAPRISFETMIRQMARHDLELLGAEVAS